MAKLIPNMFTSYELSDKEVLEGSIFTSLQKQVLQNHLVVEAEKKMLLEFDPKDSENFMQQEAVYRGKIELIQFLLQSSDISEETLTNFKSTGEL